MLLDYKKKILILGANSFIGSNLISYLSKNKINYSGFYNQKKFRLKELRDIYKLNLNDDSFTKFIDQYKPDIIINFIGNSNNDDLNIDKHVSSNINILIKILERLGNAKFKNYFLYSCSTSLEFGSSKFKIKETQKRSPKTIYSYTKFISHLIYKEWCENNSIKYTNLIFFNIFGEDKIKKDIISKILDNKYKKLIINSPRSVKDFTYINDVIKILYILLLNKKNKYYPSINICSGKGISISSIVNLIKKLDNNRFKNIIFSNNKDYERIVGDNSNLFKIIKKFEFTNIEDVIKSKFYDKA